METMMGYIQESPAQCRENIAHSKDLTKKAVEAFCSRDFNRILILASGSSYNGSCAGKAMLEKILKVKVDVVTSFTFANYETVYDKHTFIFGAGQSGRSMNTNEALQVAKDQGMMTVGLTGNVESVMKNHCDVISNWGMGIEKIGYVTKGYTTLTLYFVLFAIEAGRAKGIINEDELENWKQQLNETCDVMEKTIKVVEAWFNRNKQGLTDLKRVQILGYGPNHATALEGALKIAETTGHAATAYEQEEFLHGPSIETNEERTVIVIDSLGKPSKRANKIFETVHELTSRAYLITNQVSDDGKICTIPHTISEYLSPLFYIIPFQVISAMGKDLWINPMDDARQRMNAILLSKAPKNGNETGL